MPDSDLDRAVALAAETYCLTAVGLSSCWEVDMLALDAAFPCGDPNATRCRWCFTHRQRVQDLSLCPACDREALALAHQHHD